MTIRKTSVTATQFPSFWDDLASFNLALKGFSAKPNDQNTKSTNTNLNNNQLDQHQLTTPNYLDHATKLN